MRIVILASLLILLILAFTGWVFSVSWNFVVVPIFHLPALDFWQAVVLLILLSIISSFFRSAKGK